MYDHHHAQPPSGPRRSSIVEVKRRISHVSLARKDERAAAKERRRTEHLANLEDARKIPMDVLAAEWLDEIDAPMDMRLYLVEKLLPTLVGSKLTLKN